MNDSILQTIKQLLGPSADYEYFDTEIIIHINSVLMILTQLGIGPAGGFLITGGAETWGDFLGGRTNLEAVKSYVYLKVKKVFDPTLSTSVKAAMDELISEYEWRLNVSAESAK